MGIYMEIYISVLVFVYFAFAAICFMALVSSASIYKNYGHSVPRVREILKHCLLWPYYLVLKDVIEFFKNLKKLDW